MSDYKVPIVIKWHRERSPDFDARFKALNDAFVKAFNMMNAEQLAVWNKNHADDIAGSVELDNALAAWAHCCRN